MQLISTSAILKKILYFGLIFIFPLALSIIHSYVGINVVNNYLIALGSANQFKSILITALIKDFTKLRVSEVFLILSN